MEQGKGLFDMLPPATRGPIALAVVAGIGYAIYKIATAPGNLLESKPNRDQGKEEFKELDQLIADGKKPSISESQARAMGNAIHAAMDGYGTDEDAIVTQFNKLTNDADYLRLSTGYGVNREISSGRFNPEPNYKGNLQGGLTSELSDYWIKKINSKLGSKGLKYKI
jgi:hypothetical protein